MLEKLQRIKNYLENLIEIKPNYGIILGTGLNNLVDSLEIIKSISYENIPEFPKSTVEGHEGNLIFAKINNIDVMIMQGRFHFYEGYSMEEVTLPIRLMKILNSSNNNFNNYFYRKPLFFIKSYFEYKELRNLLSSFK